jgi:hypothetical protein
MTLFTRPTRVGVDCVRMELRVSSFKMLVAAGCLTCGSPLTHNMYLRTLSKAQGVKLVDDNAWVEVGPKGMNSWFILVALGFLRGGWDNICLYQKFFQVARLMH